MTDIQKQYSYRLPDTYYGDTWEEQKIAQAMYEGPASGWCFVDSETGRLAIEEGFHAVSDEVPDQEERLRIQAGLARVLVKLDPAASNEDALIASFLVAQDISDWPTVEYAFPDGHPNAGEIYHTDVDPLPVGDVLNPRQVFYDLENNVWKIDEIPFIRPEISKENFWNSVDAEIERSRSLLDGELTDEQRSGLTTYVGELENLFAKYDGIHHLMVTSPDFPSDLFPAEINEEGAEGSPESTPLREGNPLPPEEDVPVNLDAPEDPEPSEPAES